MRHTVRIISFFAREQGSFLLLLIADLISTLLSLSTTRLPFSVLTASLQQVCSYVSKFRTRLSAANMLHLKRLVVFLDALKKCVVEWRETRIGKFSGEKTEVMTVAELTEKLGKKVAGINFLEIGAYLKSSKVCNELDHLRHFFTPLIDC